MPPVWIGLTLAFVSALVTNTAYSLEHDAAARLPPLSPRRPFRSVQVLLRDRRWNMPGKIEYAYKGADTVTEVKNCYAYCKKVLNS